MPATKISMNMPLNPTMLRDVRPSPLRVALVGNHLPRQCGIATFTTDLCDAITAEYGANCLSVVAVNDGPSPYIYPERVCYEIAESEISSYRSAALYLNSSNVDLVCLQHEYGIFGGDAGSHVLEFLRYLTLPVVTTLHTVLRDPDTYQRAVMQQIVARSNRIIVMSQHSSCVLQEVFGVREGKIDVIPHGIPDFPFEETNVHKQKNALGGKSVLLTFGLLSPNKGFESVIRALPRILSRCSNAVYLIAGATHPHVRAREGDRYRDQLQALARQMGVEKQVLFLNRFVSPEEMASLVGSADIYVTPYCHAAQAVSGTLAYALGAGKAIISTPYWHAVELLDEGRGRLVPFKSPGAIASAAIELLENEPERLAMRERAYAHGRQMVWSRVGQAYMASFVHANARPVRTFDLGLSVRPIERNLTKRQLSA
jgi:glycosyltransferase involved in cell wall biosynthesis